MQRRVKKRNREAHKGKDKGVKVGNISKEENAEKTTMERQKKRMTCRNSPSARKLQDRVEQEMYI